MSRKTSCLESTENYIHAYNRGVDRTTIFFRESDYHYFVELMARALDDSDVLLLSYVLLPNHFHMVVEQHSPYAVSLFMKDVCEAYAKFINRSRGRCGHLFQDRFKVDEVKDAGELLRLSRYIHHNPVAAGLATSILDWKFGSCRAYAAAEASEFVAVETILSIVGGTENYMRFLEEYDPADPESVWRYVVRNR